MLNLETKKIIEQFIVDFEQVLPGVASGEQIRKQLYDTLKEDIVLAKSEAEFLKHWKKDRGMLDHQSTGYFAPRQGKIVVDWRNLEIVNQQVLFHELMHAKTYYKIGNTEYNGVQQLTIHEDGTFQILGKMANEMLNSLVEKKYVEIKTGVKKTRVNAYIPDFGDQLYTILGDALLEKYASDPIHLFEVFHYEFPDFYDSKRKDQLAKHKMYQLFLKIDQIYEAINFEVPLPQEIYQLNRQLELDIFEILSSNLKFSETLKEKLQRLEELFLLQKTPSGEDYSKVVDMLITKKEELLLLKEFPNLYQLYLISHNHLDDISCLLDSQNAKIIDFVIHQYFHMDAANQVFMDEVDLACFYGQYDYYYMLSQLAMKGIIKGADLEKVCCIQEPVFAEERIVAVMNQLKKGLLGGEELLVSELLTHGFTDWNEKYYQFSIGDSQYYLYEEREFNQLYQKTTGKKVITLLQQYATLPLSFYQQLQQIFITYKEESIYYAFEQIREFLHILALHEYQLEDDEILQFILPQQEIMVTLTISPDFAISVEEEPLFEELDLNVLLKK